MKPSAFQSSLKALSYVFIAGLVGLLAMSLVRPLLLIPMQFLTWSNEGWNAGHVARFVAGGLLYPGPTDLATTNYTPLSFLLMAPFGAAGFDLIFTGRIMALLAWLITAALIFLCSKRLGASRFGAALGTILFMAIIARFFPYYIGMYEPQWLAHAFMLLGLYVFLGAKDHKTISIAVILMLLAGFTKHNLIAVPLACFVWLFLYDRARFKTALLTALAGGAAAITAVHMAFGNNFWFNIFNARVLSLFHFSRKAEHLLAGLVPLLAWLIFTFSNKQKTLSKEAVLIHLLIAASFLEFLAFAYGVGVAANVVFDAMIALSIATAFLATQLKSKESNGAAFAAFSVFLFIQIAAWPVMKYIEVAYSADARANLYAREASVKKTIEALRAIPGPAWCEQAAICYWAGKEYTFDDFNVEMRLDTGKLTIEEMRTEMERLGIKAMQIDSAGIIPSEPATYDKSVLAPLLPSFTKKITTEGGFGAIWVRD